MEKGTHKNYEQPWTPPNPELEQAMFAAATREQIMGYDFCRERAIGQQAVWSTFKPKQEWVQDELQFVE